MSSIEKWLIAGVGLLAIGALVAFAILGLGLFGGHEPPAPADRPERVEETETSAKEPPLEFPEYVRPTERTRESSSRPEARPGGGGEIAGRVVDRNNAPIGGVQVTLVQSTRWMSRVEDAGSNEGVDEDREETLQRVVTGSDGTFRFDSVPPGEGYIVVATYQGFAEAKMAGLSVQDGETTTSRDLILFIGGIVRGIVSDDSGLPVPEARVLVLVQTQLGAGIWKTPGPSATTDGAGTFEVKSVPPGRKTVYAGAEGYATSMLPDVDVEDGAVAEGVNLTLTRGAPISGQALEATTELPIAGARISATPVFASDPTRADGETDASGNFLLTGLNPNKSYRLRATKPGYIPAPIAIAKGGTSNLVVYMERNGGIRGQVVDAVTGRPVPSFSIRFGESGGDKIVGFGQRRNFETPDGTFELIDLNPRTYLLEAWAEGYAFTRSEPIEVRKAEWVSGVVLALGQGGTVEGRVVRSSDGSAVSGASVMVRPGDRMDPFFHTRYNPYMIRESAPTGRDGRFVIANVGAGSYSIQVDHPDFAKQVVEGVQIQEGGRFDTGDIAIFQGGVIEGTVHGADGLPIFRAQMLLSGEGYRNRVRTDRDGYYRFEKVPVGSYALSVERVLGRRAEEAVFAERIVIVDEGSEVRIDF